jgi:hypothetical protein
MSAPRFPAHNVAKDKSAAAAAAAHRISGATSGMKSIVHVMSYP